MESPHYSINKLRPFLFLKPTLKSFLSDYNLMLARVLAIQPTELKRIASATINRLEGQTHFYEKIEKYLQLRNYLLENTSQSIDLKNEDSLFYRELKSEFGPRVSGNNGYLLKLWLQFPFRWIRALTFRTFVSIVCSFLNKPSEKHDTIIRSNFDHRCEGKNGKLREEYFGPLFWDLCRLENVLVVFKIIRPKDFFHYLRVSKQSEFQSCLVESFISPLAMLKIMVLYLFSYFKVGIPCIYKNTDVTRLVQRSILFDYLNLRGIVVYQEREAATNILLTKPTRILMPFENQTWEKVYPLMKHELAIKNTKIIGYQHTGLSYKLLNHFPTSLDKQFPLFPDKIITVGKIMKQVLEKEGHFPCLIEEGAALRHQQYVKEGVIQFTSPTQTIFGGIAYAFSFDLSKYSAILTKLISLFGNSSIKVFLKIHPLYKEQEVIAQTGLSLPENFILSQKIPWKEIYSKVDCILYDDNSIALEGMIGGVKTFSVDFGEPIYCCDRLFNFDLWEPNITEASLIQLRTELELGSFNKTYPTEKVADYLKDFYTPYSFEKHYHLYTT